MSVDIASIVAIIGLVVVPVLVALAFRGWLREVRLKVFRWRNGIGLAALVLSSLAWLWCAQWWVLTLIGHAPSDPIYQLNLSVVAEICAMLSVVLAIGLKGTPRLQAVAAAVLLLIACGPVGYV